MASNEGGHAGIAERTPRREWLLRCEDGRGELAICAIEVCAGEIEVIGPNEQVLFNLESSEIAAFRSALDEAIAVAEGDLAKR